MKCILWYIFCFNYQSCNPLPANQGGNVPIRKTSTGLLPLPAWNTNNLWQGYLSSDDYMSVVNPPEGFVASANNHIQDPNKPNVATFSALSHRVNRSEIKDFYHFYSMMLPS